MLASCGHRVKSYRARLCVYCGKWFCRPCFFEHISSLKIHCSGYRSQEPGALILESNKVESNKVESNKESNKDKENESS